MFWRWWIMNKAAPAKPQCSLENTFLLRACHIFMLLTWHRMSADTAFNIFWTAFIVNGYRSNRSFMPSEIR